MISLRPNETVLEGKWIAVNDAVDGDETCKRIEQLVSGFLEHVGTTDAGWTKLFLDKNDGRYWELTYPKSEWHGGGPPMLICVSDSYAQSKYGL
jgi:hypothetical protein